MTSKKVRCDWVPKDKPVYIKYHDKEWGRIVHDDRVFFEYIVLESAQAGLSWYLILKKRLGYKKAFKNFDPQKVAKLTPAYVEKLLNFDGIIRNRLKIMATISNAKCFLQIQKDFGSFDKYIWGFTNGKVINNCFKVLKNYPAKTELSDRIALDLKKRGFKFMGSTIVYAFLQSVGIVNDHMVHCFCYGKSKRT